MTDAGFERIPPDVPELRARRIDPAEVAAFVDFLRVAGRLKQVRRQGWVDRGIRDPESVADHSYRNALMAWVLGTVAGLDVSRLLKLMLLHDLPEAVIGDGTPYANLVEQGAEPSDVVGRWRDLVSSDELQRARDARHTRERRALQEMSARLPANLREELRGLWDEYALGATPEARFAAQVDKLEALLQATEYWSVGEPADVENFLASANEAIHDPLLRAVLEAVAST